MKNQLNVVNSKDVKQRNIKQTALLVASTTLALANSAYAAVPAGIKEGFEEGKTDVTTVGAYALGVVLAILAFVWFRRVMK